MTVTAVEKNAEDLSMRIESEWPATATRVWQLWADPRQLERWWGPPTFPATVTSHELSPGGLVRYFMTGPDGEQYHGGWRVLTADEPHTIEFEDFFADENGDPSPEMPQMNITVSIAERGSGSTSMVIETRFPSLEAMQQVLEMGMEEGITLALGQIDELLNEQPAV